MVLKFWRQKLSRASKPSPRRRWRPSIKSLEVRCTPTVTISLVGRQLLVSCDNTGNTVAETHSVSPAITSVKGQGFFDSEFDIIQINNGSGTDVDNITALPAKPLTIRGGGVNFVNLGNSAHGL